MKSRNKRKSPSEKYLQKAKNLSKRDAERLMSRLRGRYTRRLEDKSLTETEVQALQLEYEDEQLEAWRKRVAEIRSRKDD